MNLSHLSIPLISKGWLRAVFYIIALFILTGISLVIYIVGINKWSLDAAGLQGVMKGNKLLVISGIFFAEGLLITYVFRRWIDRKSFISLGLHLDGHFRDAIAGAGLGIFIIGASSLLLKATGHLKWMDIIFDPKAIFLSFGSIVLVAVIEELIFRGYLLSNLMDSFQKWLALVASSALFMIAHWTTLGFFPMANTLIMGMILGLNYVYTRSLWFPICLHIAWKFLEGPLLGLSGDESHTSLLQTELNGDANLTGWPNGLEGSFILTGISFLSLIVLFLFLQRKLNPGSQPVPGRI